MPNSVPIREFTFEVRYTPDASILDNRARWSKRMASNLFLPNWVILENQFTLSSADNLTNAFVTFRNAAYQSSGPHSSADFPVGVTKFVTELFALPGFPTALPVDRIGVLVKSLFPLDLSLLDLVKKFQDSYIGDPPALSVFTDTVIDTGLNVNFADSLGNYNTMAGPMPRTQSETLFQGPKDDLPEVGLYISIDNFVAKPQAWGRDRLIARIRSFIDRSIEKSQAVYDLVMAVTADA